LADRSKRYLNVLEKVDRERRYGLREAIAKVKEMASARFDESVEMHVRLNVDPRHADQQVRGTVVLPHGLGKTKRVLVFASGEKVKEAEAAGADYVGGEELVKKIESGWLEFEAAVATPDMMKVVGRLGKILGPRGLMPSAKSGTVTFDVADAVREIKMGRVEFKVDKAGIIHSVIGKASFDEGKLFDNAKALLSAIVRAKPASAKGQYVKSIALATTMSPSVKLNVSEALKEIAE